MLDELLPCANCDGQPHFEFDDDLKMVRLHCSVCLMTTEKIPSSPDRNAALTQLTNAWNQRPNRVPTTAGSIHELINKEIHAVDSAMVLEMIARNQEDWETRGPLLGELAAKCIDSALAYSDYWPIDAVIYDAARYRKLLKLARFFVVDGRRTLRFEPIVAAKSDSNMPFEGLANLSIDQLPDRNRW
ncbi:protein of unknown function (plasmid) [Pararobbsia alpina]|uniref:hypothetical protein n=1 Tax=Pararobbsia alpina TaxID=621374 RepID=UPI0039A52882